MSSHLRLKSIRFKNGGELRVLNTSDGNPRKEFMQTVNDMSATGYFKDGEIAGFAIVIWSNDGSMNSRQLCGGRSPYHYRHVAQMVGDVLKDDLTRRNVDRDIRGEW